MPRQERLRQSREAGPAHAPGLAGRWEGKRSRFAAPSEGPSITRRLTPGAIITFTGVLLLALVVGVTFLMRTDAPTASAAPIPQTPATTATTDGSQVSISADEVRAKKLVAWNYKKEGVTTPLLAYVTPSGSIKVATRLCEPCNSTSFRVEGSQLVCNACGSRWELETSRGISGGCLSYPPEVLPSVAVDGKIVVDEEKVATWKPRV